MIYMIELLNWKMEKFMKKKYEKKELLIGICISLFIMEIVVGIWIIQRKITLFKEFSCVVEKKDLLVVMLNEEEMKLFRRNKCIYVGNEKVNYKINKVIKNILKKDNVFYNQVFIEVDIDDKCRENDIVFVSMAEKNVSLINIFKIMWGE